MTGRIEKPESGSRKPGSGSGSGFRIPESRLQILNFVIFHTLLPRDLQTKANMFCIIRTSFHWKENYDVLYSYLFVKGPHILSSILQGMQREARRRIDVNHTSKTWIIHLFVCFWFRFRIPDSGFRLFHMPILCICSVWNVALNFCGFIFPHKLFLKM